MHSSYDSLSVVADDTLSSPEFDLEMGAIFNFIAPAITQ